MTETQKPLRGKVARLLNSRELAINIGSTQGVELGMRFDVLDLAGEDIRDPDTDELLGSLQRSKVRVKVVRVEPRLSVASTYRSKQVNVGGMAGADLYGVQKLFEPARYTRKYETLKATEGTWEELHEEDSIVKLGDPVVQVIGDATEE